MANRYRGGTYVGVTADLIRRVHQHKSGLGSKHVADFGKTRLVYAEHHLDIIQAIARKKLVKKWRRHWKHELIEASNPNRNDLWNDWFDLSSRYKPRPVSSTGRREKAWPPPC